MRALIFYFDILLHDKMDRFSTFTLRGKIYARLHALVHEAAYWTSPDHAVLARKSPDG